MCEGMPVAWACVGRRERGWAWGGGGREGVRAGGVREGARACAGWAAFYRPERVVAVEERAERDVAFLSSLLLL